MEFLNELYTVLNSKENSLIYLFIGLFLLKYFFCSIGCFRLMNNRKMSFKILSFIPIINSNYVVGSISDSINHDYFSETKSSYFLLMLRMVNLVALAILYKVVFYKNSILSEGFLNLFFGNISVLNFINNILNRPISIYICVFYVLVYVFYSVYLLKNYYNIYSEYGGKFKVLLIILAIYSYVFLKIYFIIDLFLFLISKKTSNFENLNKTKTYV